MPNINNIQTINLTSGGGTESLPVNSLFTLYIIKGTATLTSNWTIQPTGTPQEGLEYRFRYEADITLNGNTITIFGKTLPETLADKTHEITAYYDGTDWEVNFHLDVDENGSLPSEIISGYNLADKQEVLCIPLSFETGELLKQKITLPYDGNFDIHGFQVSITKTIEATDDAEIKFYDNSLAPMTISTGTFILTAGFTSLNNVGGDDFTSNISHTLPTHIYVETLKTTPGGKALLYLIIEKE